MKQKTLVSTFGSLIFTFSAVFLITGCPTKPKLDNIDGSSLIVKPTGEADKDLAMTFWSRNNDMIFFYPEGNIVSLAAFEAIYTVDGNTINFDISRSIAINKEMTADKLIEGSKIRLREMLESFKKELEKATDPKEKKKFEEIIKGLKEELKDLENITPEYKEIVEKQAKLMKEMAHAFAPYAKFTGTFNAEKTELTIENFPSFDQNTKTVKPTKVVLKKI